MAEKGTEAGSPQRRKKAREQGDVVRSRELVAAVALMAGVVVLGVVARGFVGSWRSVLEQSLAVRLDGGETAYVAALRRMVQPIILPVGMVMAASFVGALGVGLAQGGGLQVVPGAVGFKLGKLNPGKNLGQLVSLRAATRVVKSLVPAAAMVAFGWVAVKALMVPMPVLSLVRLPSALSTAYALAMDAAWITLAWSGLDYVVEWVSWNNRMKMTKQEIKEEMKEAMGEPAGEGADSPGAARDAATQGEGGYEPGERGDYESDALCGGAGVQL